MKLLNQQIYPAVFNRQSTRRYSDEPISQEKLDMVKGFIAETVPLLPSEEAAFDIQSHKGNTLKIAAYAKNEKASAINLAFMLQQIDLFLQTNGMGALWNATV